MAPKDLLKHVLRNTLHQKSAERMQSRPRQETSYKSQSVEARTQSPSTLNERTTSRGSKHTICDTIEEECGDSHDLVGAEFEQAIEVDLVCSKCGYNLIQA